MIRIIVTELDAWTMSKSLNSLTRMRRTRAFVLSVATMASMCWCSGIRSLRAECEQTGCFFSHKHPSSSLPAGIDMKRGYSTQRSFAMPQHLLWSPGARYDVLIENKKDKVQTKQPNRTQASSIHIFLSIRWLNKISYINSCSRAHSRTQPIKFLIHDVLQRKSDKGRQTMTEFEQCQAVSVYKGARTIRVAHINRTIFRTCLGQ